MWNVKIQFKISSGQTAFFEQYSRTFNTHSIYRKESTLLWQLLDFSTNHLPPSDLSLPRFLPKAAISLSQLKYRIWLKTSRLSWKMLMSVKVYSWLACVTVLQTALLQEAYLLPGNKATTTVSGSKFTTAETLIFLFTVMRKTFRLHSFNR